MAQNIEIIMAPGKLIQGHAKWEEDCKQCHVKFDRKAQDGLCMTCHKDVGSDVRGKSGFHGRQAETVCKSCHTEHKGRDARIADFDPKKFDHSKTDYALRNRHEKLPCEQCHTRTSKYREAPTECNACHRKDDAHKGALGAKCADCHADTGWKDTRFDHGSTDFALTGKHADVKCSDCHRDKQYKETPKTCHACHRKVDEQKGHKGQFGEKCESCHGTKQWKPSTFNHDTDTRYALRGKHRTTGCKDCHSGNLYREKLQQDCLACHRKDDKHKETLGKDCAACHSERGWKEPGKFDHDTASFPLLGKHASTECKACHKSPLFKEAPKDCFACHQKDDQHKSTLGKDCGSCHAERDWKSTTGRFGHERTRFALRNGHAKASVKCTACHKDLQSMRNTPMECNSCHRKDDKHQGKLGERCDTCHNDANWKTTRFDHGLSRFPLTGRHTTANCRSCHETQLYRDTPRDCGSCHKKDDRHKLKLGVRCESCHNTRAWPAWTFDHDRKTKYRLEGAHRKVACEACHTAPAPAGRDVAPTASACVSCHRNEDAHEGQFGSRCEQCHTTEGWKSLKARLGLSAAEPRGGDAMALAQYSSKGAPP